MEAYLQKTVWPTLPAGSPPRAGAMVKDAESEESRRRNQRYRMYLMLAAQGATNWVPKLSLASLLPLVVRRPPAPHPPRGRAWLAADQGKLPPVCAADGGARLGRRAAGVPSLRLPALLPRHDDPRTCRCPPGLVWITSPL